VLERDDGISRLSSAAELEHATFTYDIDDIIDSATILDCTYMHANITTTWNEQDSPDDNNNIYIDRFDLNQIFDWNDDLDNDPPDHLCPAQLPDFHDPLSSSVHQPDLFGEEPTIIHALSALDEQLNKLGITRSEFYRELRQTETSFADSSTVRAHFDGGSMATTTDQLHCLWHYRPFHANETPQLLQVADRHKHRPTGIGYLRIPLLPVDKFRSCLIRCLYTPTLPATIVSPYDVGLQYNCSGYSCASHFDGTHCTVTLHCRSLDYGSALCFPQILLRGLLFSEPILLPDQHQHTAPVPSDMIPTNTSNAHETLPLPVRQLSREQQRILWHQRLGHIHHRRISQAHKFADGIPIITNATDLDKCPICARAKLHKANRGTNNSRRATKCFQGISIDFGFIVQSSNADSTRVKRLQGMHGETCYCLIVDHHSGMLFGQCFRSKAPPLDFLRNWIATHGLTNEIPDRYVRFDLGGELGRCADVLTLFENAGYQVESIAPDSSHQNGPGERPHRTIADAIRTMLAGAALPPKFWPYAFHHFLRLYNVTVHGDKTASPFEICTTRKPDLSLLRVFGCRVYALPSRPRRPTKILPDSRTGIFLGFAKTMKNILCYDTETETVKTAQHVIFDEAMRDIDHPPPNARLLATTLHEINDVDFIDLHESFPDIDISTSPFTKIDSILFDFDANDLDYPIGLSYRHCQRLRRPFIEIIHRSPSARQNLRTFRRKYTGAYITAIDDKSVYNVDDIDKIINDFHALREPPAQVNLSIAPEPLRDLSDNAPPPLHLRQLDLEHISFIESTIPSDYSPLLSINRLQTDGMIPEERVLPKLTRHRLKKLPNWSTWDEAFDAQLDAHLRDGAIGEPVPRPKTNSRGGPPNILRIHWSCCVKTDGRRKARACIDGSKRAAPWLRETAHTYASCIEQPCMKLFFAICASLGFFITYGDVDNAYQNSPSPTEPCFLEADEAYCSWYLKRTGRTIDPRTHVIPALRAIQGHPEAGRLWQDFILSILQSPPLSFTTTTHERNLYRGTIDGALVIVARQVDDFAIGSHDPSTANRLIEIINSHVSTKNQGIGSPTSLGISHRYNGLDVHQTRHYIKLSCETYIQRVLQTHGWETPGPKESDRPDSVPLHPDVASKIALLSGPAEGSTEFSVLAAEMKFGYRQLLGELIYAYILVRVDIGFAVCFLARFSTNPHREHYLALKNIARYLRRTFDWGIIYWRANNPVMSLPEIPFSSPPIDSDLPHFPSLSSSSLVGFVDASHASCLKTRRSITGIAFCYGGSTIAYKSKVQPIVATSSTEAEFYAAVTAAKLAKYFRSILSDLGFPISTPTPLFEDNEAAIAMVNENRPTPRVRHLDTQYFAIQEWRHAGIIQMFHIPGVINPADQQTKPLASRLHNRHVRRIMGHYGHE
jgi:hypothetical protein